MHFSTLKNVYICLRSPSAKLYDWTETVDPADYMVVTSVPKTEISKLGDALLMFLGDQGVLPRPLAVGDVASADPSVGMILQQGPGGDRIVDKFTLSRILFDLNKVYHEHLKLE